jgi:CheY-like chemotaxis protein
MNSSMPPGGSEAGGGRHGENPRAAASGADDPSGRNARERRRRRRALISAPVRVRANELTGCGPDEISTTIDVSRVGILFVGSHPSYARGMDVRVIFPYSSAPTALHAEQDGRVARVFEMPDGRRAVAIAFGAVGKGDLVDSSGRPLNDSPAVYGSDPPQSEKPLVLVVDSDPSVRESLKGYLVDEGYKVLAVNNASDGREVLKLFTPALVIAEIEGEDLPGYAICSHVKGTPRLRSVPVVLITSSAYPSDYSSAHSLGAMVCMAKPYRKERLGHIVRLLAPLPHTKLPVAPPRPADPSRRPGGANRNGFRSGANASMLWRFRSSK